MKAFIPLAAAALLAGCAAPKIAVEYRPQTTLEIDGSVKVNEFSYFPKKGVPNTVIPNTALGAGLQLPEPVSTFFSNAVRRELRQAGMSLKGTNCKLDGEVNQILIDDLGFTVDFVADVRYILRTNDNKLLADIDAKTGLYKMEKFVPVDVIFTNLNKMFSDNIQDFMKNKQFQTQVEQKCR